MFKRILEWLKSWFRKRPMNDEPKGHFVVAQSGEVRSSIWRWWIGKNTDDIYLSTVPTGDALKVSLHCGDSGKVGQFQFSIAYEFLKAEAKRTGEKKVPLPGGSRHFEKTASFHQVKPGVRRLFALVFPTEGLGEDRGKMEEVESLKIITPENENSTRIEVVVTGPEVSIQDWPGKSQPGTRLLASATLPSGARFWLVYWGWHFEGIKLPPGVAGSPRPLKFIKGDKNITREELLKMNLRTHLSNVDPDGILFMVETKVTLVPQGPNQDKQQGSPPPNAPSKS